MATIQEVFHIIDKASTLMQKIQELADEALNAAQKPPEDPKLTHVPVWFQATVLFDFSLGFLCITYPEVKPERQMILEVFKNTLINMNPQRNNS